MDLKNVPGSSGSGEPKASTDVTFSLSDTDFHKLFEGKTIIYIPNHLLCYFFKGTYFYYKNLKRAFEFLFVGKLNPTSAFMSGKLKMEGNLGKAMALEKVMKKMNTRGYHTSTHHRQHPIITNNNNNLNDFGKHKDLPKSKL